METFEQRRRGLAERVAARLLPMLNASDHLVPTADASPVPGPHHRAAGYDLRSSVELAVALADTDRADEAWPILSRILDYQDRQADSLTYGNFFWRTAWDRILDPNAASFIVPLLAHLHRAYAQAMPKQLCRRLSDSLKLAVDGLNAHRATWGYTNIALLNMAAKLMIGNALNDPRATRLAFWDWEEWRNHTGRIGMITEYTSVTYSSVQLNALGMLASCRAPAAFLAEVRAVLRHALTALWLDFHPAIGRITGAQSRAYIRDRRFRECSIVQNVLHLVWGLPIDGTTARLWVGAPIGPQDIVPEARQPALPRTTKARTYGFTRTNYLAPDFALGSIDGRAHWIGHEAPYFLAYRSASPRCSVPVLAEPEPDAHYARQHEGTLLAAVTWLFDTAGAEPPPDGWQAAFSGLKTGRPDTLVRDPDRSAALVAELGAADVIRLLDAEGRPVTENDGALPGSMVALETESVRVCLRFFGPIGEAQLGLNDEEGEWVLRAEFGREGRRASPRERMVVGGLLLHVEPHRQDEDLAGFARRLREARIRLTDNADGWHMVMTGAPRDLALDVPADPPLFYAADGCSVTANQWAASLAEGGPGP